MNPQVSLHLSLSFFLFLFILLEGKQSLSVGMFDQRFISINLCSIILVFLDIKIGYYPIPTLFCRYSMMEHFWTIELNQTIEGDRAKESGERTFALDLGLLD